MKIFRLSERNNNQTASAMMAKSFFGGFQGSLQQASSSSHVTIECYGKFPMKFYYSSLCVYERSSLAAAAVGKARKKKLCKKTFATTGSVCC